MDGAINFFNVECGVFLRYLHCFANIDNVQISAQTVDLLKLINRLNIDLMNKANVVEVNERTDVDFLLHLDEKDYALRRYILCRECSSSRDEVYISLSRDEVENHVHVPHYPNELNRTASTEYSASDEVPSPVSNVETKMANSNTSFSNDGDQSGVQASVEDSSDSDNPYDITQLKYNDVVAKFGVVQTKPDIRTSTESITSKASTSCLSNRAYVIKMRGLPWAATKKEIGDYFVGIRIANGLNGIHFLTDDQNNFGVAYVEFDSKKNFNSALGFHKKKLGDRYIEVLKATEQDYRVLNEKIENEDLILRLEGLPWTADKDDIRKFFSGLRLKKINMIYDKFTHQTLEAFVRFSSIEDYDSALKRNWQLMGTRHIKIFRSSEKQLKLRLKSDVKNQQEDTETIEREFPPLGSVASSKNAEKFSEPEWQEVGPRRSQKEKNKVIKRTYTVLARGFQWKVTKADVIKFFKGVKIVDGEDGITIEKNVAMEAKVILGSKNDLKKAIGLHNKTFESRTITVTEVEQKVEPESSPISTSSKNSKYVVVRGLPWTVEKDYIARMFPGMKINYDTGIQIEQDENLRKTGYAYVQFDKPTEYEAAFNLDFKHINPYLKLFKSSKEDFDRTTAANKAYSKAIPKQCQEFQQEFPMVGVKSKQRS